MQAPAFVIATPNAMAFRALVESEVLARLRQHGKRHLMVLLPAGADPARLPDGVQWRSITAPCQSPPTQRLWRRACRFASVRLSEWLGLGYGNIAYRFNQRHGFAAHRFKQKLDKARTQREALAGNYVDPAFGFPFPASCLLYRLIYRFYYARWQVPDRSIERFFEETEIETVVLWYVQNPLYRDYSICCRKHRIRTVGVIGSWDRLTTKGPIAPGCGCYIVNNRMMRDELVRFHGVDADTVSIVGWPQMDCYHDHQVAQGRAEFLKNHRIDPTHRLLVFAGNSERLGRHEPDIAAFLARQINEQAYGKKITLWIRTHPNDSGWQARYRSLEAVDNVVLMPAGAGNIALLANLLRHADVVICTQGTITLDAAAFDCCIVNIAFDGERRDATHDSVVWLYEMDHYRPVVETGGVRVVGDFDALDQAIGRYLSQPGLDRDGRSRLASLYLAPFDGHASERQARAMIGET